MCIYFLHIQTFNKSGPSSAFILSSIPDPSSSAAWWPCIINSCITCTCSASIFFVQVHRSCRSFIMNYEYLYNINDSELYLNITWILNIITDHWHLLKWHCSDHLPSVPSEWNFMIYAEILLIRIYIYLLRVWYLECLRMILTLSGHCVYKIRVGISLIKCNTMFISCFEFALIKYNI